MNNDLVKQLTMGLLGPVLTIFRQQVANKRAAGCSELEIEQLVVQLQTNLMIVGATNAAFTPELIQLCEDMFREAARLPKKP